MAAMLVGRALFNAAQVAQVRGVPAYLVRASSA
jgi:hypothetical protein